MIASPPVSDSRPGPHGPQRAEDCALLLNSMAGHDPLDSDGAGDTGLLLPTPGTFAGLVHHLLRE